MSWPAMLVPGVCDAGTTMQHRTASLPVFLPAHLKILPALMDACHDRFSQAL